MTRHAAPLALLVMLIAPVFAQRSVPVGRPGDPGVNIEIVVHVLFTSETHAGEHITVLLESPGSGAMAQAFTNSEGKAVFTNVRPGQYVIRVRDQTIRETTTRVLNLEYERTHHEFIRAEARDSRDASLSTPPAAPATTVKIPDKARKEFEKGNSALSAGDTQKAMQHYEKAIQLYPQFAVAYNNLAAL